MKTRATILLLAGLTVAACSRATEAPQLGVPSAAAPTQSEVIVPASSTPVSGVEVSTPAPEATAKPTKVPPTPGLPEGAILLPTLPRQANAASANTPVPLFPSDALQATLAALPPATPDVAIYSSVFQSFQGGAMMYIAELRQIWVLVETPGKRGGPYYRFDDLFVQGDTEEIAGLSVPEGLLQPHRGFGRIWREQPGLRAQLGWATDYEVPFSMRVARVTSGAFDALGNFVVGKGLWMMTLHDNSIVYVNEVTNTWGIAANQ